MSIHTIRHFMTTAPETIHADLTLSQARERMFRLEARHLPVVDNDVLVGILSDRDVALSTSLGCDLERTAVRQAMTAPVFTCGPDAHLHAVADEMARHKYGSAIVVDHDEPLRVIGLFTTTDALRALAQVAGHGSGAA